MVYSILGGLVLVIILYMVSVRYFLQQSWQEAQIEELKAHQMGEQTHPTGGEHPWLFHGPVCTPLEARVHILVHWPARIRRMIVLFAFSIPILALKILKHRIQTGNWQWRPVISSEVLFDVLVNSTLLLISEITEQGALVMRIPEELPLETKIGLKPAGFCLCFDVATKEVLSAQLPDRDITEDHDLILCLLMQLVVHWAHTQSHIFSELSAREIGSKQITQLQPSQRFVTALHTGLMYSPLSPISDRTVLHSEVVRDSFISSAKVPIWHVMDKKKMQFSYYNFLFQARMALIKCLKKHQIEVNVEYLFINMIVHSVDHYLMHKYMGRCDSWTMDGSKRLKSYFTAKISWAIWLPDYESWIEKERISRIDAKKYPFYRDLYEQLVLLDKELAGSVLASTSF